MPHSNAHTKTKEGYLIEIEYLLNLSVNLPLAYYRIDIESAAKLYNTLHLSGAGNFIALAKKMKLPIKIITEQLEKKKWKLT